jgi:transcriptional regulator of heat shock response
MHDLTQRQIEILKSLIEEYIETAEPVGSETLEKKHSLSASPATIRNEMVKLTELGYLKKTHISSGRVPTSVALKFYVKQLMKEKELSVAEEVALKEKVWDLRDQERSFLKLITHILADKTKTLAITTTQDGEVFCAGYANILDMPEFYDIDLTRTLLSAVDEMEIFQTLFEGIIDDDEVHILMEDELGPDLNGPLGMVFTRFQTPMKGKGEIGILGPARLNYNYIVPTVRYFGNLIEEIARGW